MADSRTSKVPSQSRDDPAAAPQATGLRRLDLSAVPNWNRNVVEPRFAIPYIGYVGQGTVRAADEIRAAAKGRGLPSPAPSALELHGDETEATTVYGIPVMRRDPADLSLDWVGQTHQVRANFQLLLNMNEMKIPPGTKMMIQVEHIQHENLGHCVKLSWAGDCFAPIHEQDAPGDQPDNP